MADVSAYDPIFETAGNEWNVDPQLLKAMAIQESGGRANAVSRKGALGVMQIMPETAKTLGITDPTDPVQSIYGAAKYMNQALDTEGSPEKALLYYHGGSGWRQAYGPESAGYVPAVTKHYQILGQFKAALKDPDPSVTTDASAAAAPAPAAPTGAGKAMASNDPLSLLPPAPKPSAGGAATTAPDDPLSLLPPAPKPPPAAKDWRDDYPASDPSDIVPPTDNPVSRIIGAGVEGAEAVPHIPRVPGDYITAPFYNPLIAGAETALRAGGGALRGLQQAAVELTPDIHLGSVPTIPLGGNRSISGELTPGSLGREVAALPEAFPFGFNALRSPGRPPIPEAPPPGPRFMSEIAAPPRSPGMTDAARINQLVEHAVNEEQPSVGPPMETGLGYRPDVDPTKPFTYNPPSSGWPAGTERWAGGGAPATEMPVLTAEERAWASGAQERLQEIKAANQAAGVPGDLGAAATPEQLAQLTPQQMKAYRRQAELGEALAPAERGMDRKIYVEGSKPTKAEYSGDAEVSQQESLERERAPKQHDAVQEENNAARVRKFEGMMGSDIQVDDLKVAKAKAAETDGNAFLQAARPIDLTPAAEWIDGQLADPRVQARADVVKKLGDLRKSLFDADGNMRTEPGYGWGLHDEVMADLEKAKDTTRAERYSKSQLLQWKKIIDGVNDDASDGAFRKFLDNQSDYAARINALELLQKYRPKLTSGKTGMILPTAYHRFVADLAMRRGNPGIDAAMDIPDETMRGLLNIGKDLKRADNIDLGKARGSPTNLLFSLAKGTGIGMAHAAFSAMPGTTGVGNILLQGALNAASTATGNVLLRRRVNRSLAPPPGGYDYSPLQPP